MDLRDAYLIHQLLLLRGVEVKLGHLKSISFALLFAEAEHDDGGETAHHDHLDDLEDVATLGAPLNPSLLTPLISLKFKIRLNHNFWEHFENLNVMVFWTPLTSLLVSHVVDLVKDDPPHLPHHLAASVQH